MTRVEPVPVKISVCLTHHGGTYGGGQNCVRRHSTLPKAIRIRRDGIVLHSSFPLVQRRLSVKPNDVIRQPLTHCHRQYLLHRSYQFPAQTRYRYHPHTQSHTPAIKSPRPPLGSRRGKGNGAADHTAAVIRTHALTVTVLSQWCGVTTVECAAFGEQVATLTDECTHTQARNGRDDSRLHVHTRETDRVKRQ